MYENNVPIYVFELNIHQQIMNVNTFFIGINKLPYSIFVLFVS